MPDLPWMSRGVPATDNCLASLLLCSVHGRYLKLCRTVEEMQDKCPGQKLVLTSPASLSSGFSRELFADWAADVRNTVLFSAWAPPGSLAHSLQSQVC